jgi:predicted  nucleic acid-binding Zn-ribbon protein
MSKRPYEPHTYQIHQSKYKHAKVINESIILEKAYNFNKLNIEMEIANKNIAELRQMIETLQKINLSQQKQINDLVKKKVEFSNECSYIS